MTQRTKRTTKRAAKSGMSDRSKRIVLAVLASVLVVGGGWWAYYEFTTQPPPDLTTANAADVTSYLGSPRGFARLPVDRRQDFLVHSYQRFGQGDGRTQFARSLNRMSRRQREVFLDAFFDLARVRVMECAKEFAKIPSRRRQARFVDRTIRDFEAMRQPLRAPGPGPARRSGRPVVSLADPFRDVVPKGSDELMKVVVSRTTARERAEAKPFVDAVATRYKQYKAARQQEGS